MNKETEDLSKAINDQVADYMKNSNNPLMAGSDVFIALSMVAATHVYCTMPPEHRKIGAELFGKKISTYVKKLSENPLVDFMAERAVNVK